MIGWSRRNSESRRRNARWYNSLTKQQQEDETCYQEYVNRTWLPLTVLFFLTVGVLTFTLDRIIPQRALIGLMFFGYIFSLAGPVFFVMRKSKWRQSSAYFMESKGWGPWRQEWYSFCSRHRRTDPKCHICSSGHWVNVWRVRLGSLVFKASPDLWRWWANRPRNKQAWLDSISKRSKP